MKKKLSHKELEKEEERTGKDLDNDKEKGESEAHKNKMKLKGWKEWLLEREKKDVHDKPGGSNVGKERETSGANEGPFCGPSGNAPAKSYPVTNRKQWHAAKSYAHNAPNPQGVKDCADRIAKKKGWKDKEK